MGANAGNQYVMHVMHTKYDCKTEHENFNVDAGKAMSYFLSQARKKIENII